VFGLATIPAFVWLFWSWTSSPTLTTLTKPYQVTGTEVKQDLESKSTLTFQEVSESYQIVDTKDGIDIQFANQTASDPLSGETAKLTLNFPKDYSQPLSIKLDNERTIEITDLGGKGDYTVDTIGQEPTQEPTLPGQEKSFLERLLSLRGLVSQSKSETPQHYLRYTSKDQRKSLLYAFQKDQASGEKQLKHWTLYKEGDGVEKEAYQFTNSKIKINEVGVAEVFYYGEKQINDEKVKAEVDSNLMERAQRTLQKELGEDLLNTNHTPDFTIPKPYYIDNQGAKHEGEWKLNDETNILTVNITTDSYPIALDPTLSFTAPGDTTTGSVITGESASNFFGTSLTAGDFNSDGRMDLAVGATGYSSSTGRVYLFYNDGGIATTAATADVIITGPGTNWRFAWTLLTSGDFNDDGKADLVVGATSLGGTGKAYIFYNDGSIPSDAASADITITGEAASSLGVSLASGDFNADGEIDLAVGASGYTTNTGRVYIFYGSAELTAELKSPVRMS